LCFQQSFHDLKSGAEEAYTRASQLLPKLEEAYRIARDAREPASEAERRWQEAHSQLSSVQGQALAAIQELRAGAHAALGGPESVTRDMLRHHAHHRLQSFRETLPNVSAWRAFWPTVSPLSWLPGASILTQAVACLSDDAPFLIACVSVATAPLDD